MRKRVVLGISGSVAAIKAEEMVDALRKEFDVRVVMTKAAMHFTDVVQLKTKVPVFTDEDEWAFQTRSDPVLHIELRQWADLMIIAPCSANTLAKLANGLCDNLLTCIVRAWDTSNPLLIAPAMNTLMYSHPITAQHLTTIRQWRTTVIDPVIKELVCGDVGVGAMAPVSCLVDSVRAAL